MSWLLFIPYFKAIFSLSILLILAIISYLYKFQTKISNQKYKNFICSIKRKGDIVPYNLSDITKKISTTEIEEKKGFHESRYDYIDEKIFGFKRKGKTNYFTSVDFSFEYNGITIDSHEIFPIEKDKLKLHFSVKGTVNVFIYKEEKIIEGSMEELNLSSNFHYDGKYLYTYYMDFGFLGLNEI